LQYQPREQDLCACPCPVVDKSLPPASLPAVHRGPQQHPPLALPAFHWRGSCRHPAPTSQVSTQGLLGGAGGIAQPLRFRLPGALLPLPGAFMGNLGGCSGSAPRTHPALNAAHGHPQPATKSRTGRRERSQCSQCREHAPNDKHPTLRRQPRVAPGECDQPWQHGARPQAAAEALSSRGGPARGCCAGLRLGAREPSLALAPVLTEGGGTDGLWCPQVPSPARGS